MYGVLCKRTFDGDGGTYAQKEKEKEKRMYYVKKTSEQNESQQNTENVALRGWKRKKKKSTVTIATLPANVRAREVV